MPRLCNPAFPTLPGWREESREDEGNCRIAGRRIEKSSKLGCLLVVAVLLQACTSTRGGSDSRSLLAASARMSDDRFLALATDELTKRCMERKGFPFNTVSLNELPPESGSDQWGIDDVSVAREHGYGLSEKDFWENWVDPNQGYLSSLSPEERERWELAFSGRWENRIRLRLPDGAEFSMPGEGCNAEADQQVYGDLRKYLELRVAMMQIAPEANQRVAADPSYTSALAVWSECMKDKGYRFEQRADAIAAAQALYDSPAVSAADAKSGEIRVAVSDARCAARAGVVRIARQLERGYTRELLGEREGQYAAWRELQEQAVARAKRLLAQR